MIWVYPHWWKRPHWKPQCTHFTMACLDGLSWWLVLTACWSQMFMIHTLSSGWWVQTLFSSNIHIPMFVERSSPSTVILPNVSSLVMLLSQFPHLKSFVIMRLAKCCLLMVSMYFQTHIHIHLHIHLHTCSYHCPIIVPSCSHHVAIIVPSLFHHFPMILPSFSHHVSIIVPSCCHMFHPAFHRWGLPFWSLLAWGLPGWPQLKTGTFSEGLYIIYIWITLA